MHAVLAHSKLINLPLSVGSSVVSTSTLSVVVSSVGWTSGDVLLSVDVILLSVDIGVCAN